MVEFEFKERIAKPHAYAPCPSDFQLLAKCGRSSGVCDGSHNMQEGVRKQKCSDSGVSERGCGPPSAYQAQRVSYPWSGNSFIATKVIIRHRT